MLLVLCIQRVYEEDISEEEAGSQDGNKKKLVEIITSSQFLRAQDLTMAYYVISYISNSFLKKVTGPPNKITGPKYFIDLKNHNFL